MFTFAASAEPMKQFWTQQARNRYRLTNGEWSSDLTAKMTNLYLTNRHAGYVAAPGITHAKAAAPGITHAKAAATGWKTISAADVERHGII